MSDTKKHFDYGPSAAKQWQGCPGSVAYVKQLKEDGTIPEDNDTDYSKEGTQAHDYADKFLKGEIQKHHIPQGFRDHLMGYFAFAEHIIERNPHGSKFTEQRVPLFYAPEEGGTLDFAVASSSVVEILDLKYGVGVKVDAENNPQLAIYATSLMMQLHAEFNFMPDTIVRMHIYQPRHFEFEGPETWEIRWRDLQAIALTIEVDFERAKKASPSNLIASPDACKFCDARRVCETRIRGLFEEVPLELVPMNEGGPQLGLIRIDDKARLNIFKHHKEITKFMEDINADTLRMLESGVEIEGLKLVKGREGNRQWVDPKAVSTLVRKYLPLKEQRFKPRELITVRQMEKAIETVTGKSVDEYHTNFSERFRSLTTRSEAKNTLALESDKRPAKQALFDAPTSLEDCI